MKKNVFKVKIIISFVLFYIISCNPCGDLTKPMKLDGVNISKIMSLPLNQMVPKNYIFRKNMDSFAFTHTLNYKKVSGLFHSTSLYACSPADIENDYESYEIVSLFDFNDTIKSGKNMVKDFIIRNREYDTITKSYVYKFYNFSLDVLNFSNNFETIICLPISPKNDSAKFRIKMNINGNNVETSTPTIYYQ